MRFILGVSLIIVAYLIGYGLPIVLGVFIKNKKLAVTLAGGLWLFSWVPFLIGVALAGKEGVTWVKQKTHFKSKVQNPNVK